MTDKTDPEKETIALIIRKCDVCGDKSVPLEGIGADCRRCTGEYVARTGVKTVSVRPGAAANYREAYPDAIAE